MDERLTEIQARMAQMAEHVTESEYDQRAILRRLDELEHSDGQQNDMHVALQREDDAIDALHEMIDMLARQMTSVSDRVSAIEKEPGERWKKISFELIKSLVLAAVGAAIGYLSK